ncbi:hypothetical protein HNP46_007196 [Pseudomonas nitritireducens]|uniref:DUF5983 domain-containing protein n=1 Tax=Pseudomonas nitroreducens TaxID=46680 RepID=A0A7W7KTN1_PSENT|nr:ABC transporter substrate-binding protein [Pseudomonas nitritireducens]MBB4868273.1 hypothetical protein [Pseudomonas nitritireducens]
MPYPNPFRRGYDKLAIQLHIQSLPEHPELRELSYVIHAQEGQRTVIIGIQPTLEAAQDIVRRLSFETGHFSRCWEICMEHLPESVADYLFLLAAADKPSTLRGLQVEFFELSAHRMVGCKLLNTPWSDEALYIHDTNLAQLRQQQLDYGLPAEVVDILQLAGQADVRFLLFDPDAARLNGLPVFSGVA